MSIEAIETELRKYFTTEGRYLPILDPEEASEIAKRRGGYVGVSINYIKKYVLKKNVRDDILFFVIGKLYKEDFLNMIYCGMINNMVIEHIKVDHERSSNQVNKAFKGRK